MKDQEKKDVINLLVLILDKDIPFNSKLLTVQRMCESVLYEIKTRENEEPIQQG